MQLSVNQIDERFLVVIDGNAISNVTDYKITSSAHNRTELELKICVPDDIKVFVIEAKKSEH